MRFLVLFVTAWAGVRASALGLLPGASMFSITPSEAKQPPPIVPTQFAAIEPVQPAPERLSYTPVYATGYGPPPSPHQAYVPAYYPAPTSSYLPQPQVPASRRQFAAALPEPEPAFYSAIPRLDEWPTARMAAASWSPLGSGPRFEGPQSRAATAVAGQIDRLQLTTWAFLRGTQGMISGPRGISPAGTLGASQAGARLTYNYSRQLAASLRTSSDVGRRGGEVAAGVRLQPMTGIPLWITAERRQRIGRYGGGRNAFAMFAEGGVYDRALPWKFSLDAYLAAGVVGLRHRDRFVDGAATVTRPVYRQFSAGLGVWGGAQPGVARLDAGPRVTMRVRGNLKVHLDYRFKVAGKAQPGSGPALTLAGDF